ncbi:hypothetical protein DPMN_044986 [Dreissena polymorpha]|uniref:Uncharacterized protein n=1 Tax=Dreissena polymorpha TaxID=45954 RepID=A0A9D4HZG2_DREPO|nr:hypothetical protein DPMN_044986 [Dreissena polymorpha]
MARQRPMHIPTPHVCPRGTPGLVMGPCIVEIDHMVIREVQNEEIIVKGNFGWAWPMWVGHPRVGNGAMHMNQLKGNFGWVWPILAGRPRINCIVIREVQYQFEENCCRNEEIIVKGNFVWAWPMWAGCPRIDRNVIRKVQYQFEVNRCRNEEIIVKLQFWLGVAYVGGAPQVEIDRIVIREFQGSMARTDGQTDRQTTGQTAEITTISPRFSKSQDYQLTNHLKSGDPRIYHRVNGKHKEQTKHFLCGYQQRGQSLA